jgi:hypothetical protein
MLYLIKLKGETNTLLKIGYTKNIDKRLKTYKTHNPLIELIDIKEGSIFDESCLHNQLKEYLFDNSKEWFIENDEIYNIWKSYNRKVLSEEQEETILKIKIFKKLIELARLLNPKDSEYFQIYLGEVTGCSKDAMFKYFFKDELHINKTDYIKEITELSRENFLLPTKREDLYILNPIMVEYIDSLDFNIF